MRKRIFILKLDAIGDFALFSSMLPHLRNTFSMHTLTLGVNPDVFVLAKGCPYVDEIIPIDPDRFTQDITYSQEIGNKLYSFNDIVINAIYTRTWPSDNIVARTHAPVKIGFECNDRDVLFEHRRLTQVLYTNLVPSREDWMFEIDRYVDLLEAVGIKVNRKDLVPNLWLTQEELGWAEIFLREHNPTGRPYCIVCPGAGFNSKLWSTDKYVPVLRNLVAKHGLLPLILGSEKDRQKAEEIVRQSDCGALDFTGKLNLREFTALITKAGLYVGIDTAGFHLAWIYGVPSVGIFGGGHDTRFIPDLPHVSAVRVPMECYRCYWQCIYDEVKCITSITSDMVVDKVDKLLSSSSKR